MKSNINRLRFLGLALLIAGLTAGCEQAPPTELSAEAAPLLTRGQVGKPLPFRATANFTGELIAPGAPGSADRCNALGLFTLAGEGSGVATHLGQYSGFFSNCTAFPIPGPVDIVAGEVTVLAANGDELCLTYSGVQEAVDLATLTAEYHASYVITGGTGRFASASGMLEATGLVDFESGRVQENAEGWIAYDASDRRNR